MSIHELKNNQLKVAVSTHGAELISAQLNDTEYMWDADEHYWARVSPVLFPFVGGLQGKEYRIDGTSYAMEQHGFARDMNFSFSRTSETEMWFSLISDENTLSRYPYAFELLIGYETDGNELKITWKVKNTDKKTMYFSIGAHPAFLCPPNDKMDQSDCYLQFDNDTIHYQKINSEGLFLDAKYNLPLDEQHAYRIKTTTFDDDALIVQDGQAHTVSLLTSDKQPYVTVNFEAPLFGLWSPAKKEAPFICIEPWYGRCDAVGYDGELKDREYEQTLDAGKTFTASYTITYLPV